MGGPDRRAARAAPGVVARGARGRRRPAGAGERAGCRAPPPLRATRARPRPAGQGPGPSWAAAAPDSPASPVRACRWGRPRRAVPRDRSGLVVPSACRGAKDCRPAEGRRAPGRAGWPTAGIVGAERGPEGGGPDGGVQRAAGRWPGGQAGWRAGRRQAGARAARARPAGGHAAGAAGAQHAARGARRTAAGLRATSRRPRLQLRAIRSRHRRVSKWTGGASPPASWGRALRAERCSAPLRVAGRAHGRARPAPAAPSAAREAAGGGCGAPLSERGPPRGRSASARAIQGPHAAARPAPR
jgi:hypothetical protein